MQFCLSKGLGAPIGSVVVGDADLIERVRRVRKMLGGGMRQAGIIAAAGIIAIREHGRLAEDHANARRLADGLATIDGVDVDPASVQTNIVMFRVPEHRVTRARFLAEAHEGGVSLAELGHGRVGGHPLGGVHGGRRPGGRGDRRGPQPAVSAART